MTKMKPTIQKFGMMVAMLLSFLSVHAYDFEVDGICYKRNADNMSVEVCKPSSHYKGRIVIPDHVLYQDVSYIVSGISSSSFDSSPALISIELPSTIKTLPDYVFSHCTALREIILGSEMMSIPENAFLACSAITKINLPESITFIGECAFKGCSSLSEITIPSNVTEIDKSAFVGCKALSSIKFADSNSILRIGYGYYEGSNKGAFDDCPLYDIYG